MHIKEVYNCYSISKNNLYDFFINESIKELSLREKLTIFVIISLFALMMHPAYAVVTSVSLTQDSFSKDERFAFEGKESDGGKSIFVILRNTNGKYIGMVSDPVSDPDGSFDTIPRPVE